LELGDKAGQGRAYGNMGNAHYSLGNYRDALRNYEKAVQIAHRLGDIDTERIFLNNIAILKQEQQKRDPDNRPDNRPRSQSALSNTKERLLFGVTNGNADMVQGALKDLGPDGPNTLLQSETKAIHLAAQHGEQVGCGALDGACVQLEARRHHFVGGGISVAILTVLGLCSLS